MFDIYKIGAVLVIVTLLLIYHFTKVSTLEDMLSKTQSKLDIATKQSNSYKESLDIQTQSIESIKSDYEVKINEFKNKPAKVRYEVIYRDILKDVNTTKGDDCNEVKQVIDNIRHINFNSL